MANHNKKVVDGVIEFPEFDSSTIPNPDSGKVYLYLNSGSLKQKDSAGSESSVGGGGAGSGDVVGPASSTNNNIAVFNGTTGKIIKDGGATVASLATLASPTFTGTPAAPTASPGTNTTQVATTAFVATSYAPLASPALTGNPTAPTQSQADNSTKLATTAYVDTGLGGKSPTASPTFTGTPAAPTATAGTNTTQIATTAFVQTARQKRVQALTDAATVTPDMDSYDAGYLAELSQTTTIANPTGTPTNFQPYILRIKSTTSRTLNWGSQYRGSDDQALPTSTSGTSKTDYLVFNWNAQDSKLELTGKNFGF